MTEQKSLVAYGQRCLLCRNDSRAGGTLCWRHCDEIDAMLDPDNEGNALANLPPSIPLMYAALDAEPGASGLGERRAPGFASAPPCRLHVVAMRDDRSCSYPVVEEWYSSGPPTLAHPGGMPDYDRPHREEDRAPRAVAKSLGSLAEAVQAELNPGRPACSPCSLRRFAVRVPSGVDALAEWLHERRDVLTRLDWADEVYRDLRELREQLRHAIGDPAPEPIGYCTAPVVERGSGETVECGHPLWPPAGSRPMARDEPVGDVPVIRCGRCRAEYDGLAQLRLRIAELRGTG